MNCPPRLPGRPAHEFRPPAPLAPFAHRWPRAPPPCAPRTGGAFTANLKADDFVALCELVRTLCGVDLGQYKRNQMERRVRTFAERRGTPDLAEYGKQLRKDPQELDAFLDRVTINVSHLWRHEDQFEVLRTKLLPELAERRRLKIWSRRLLLRRRGLHDRRGLQGDDPDDPRRDHRHRPRQAHGRPRPRGKVHR